MLSKTDEFSENFQGGVISNPNNFVAVFLRYFCKNFRGKNDDFLEKGGVIPDPKNLAAKSA